MAKNNIGLGINVNVGGNAKKAFGGIGNAFGQYSSLLPGGIDGTGSMIAKFGAAGVAVFGVTKLFGKLSHAVGQGIEDYENFSSQMAEVSTLLNQQQREDLPAISQKVIQMSKDYGQSTDTMTAGLYQAVSAGVAFEDSMEFMTKASMLAVGGVTDVATSVDGLVSVMNAYGLQIGDMDRISDLLFVTMKQGRTTIGELSASIGQATSIAFAMEVPIESLLASTAALTKVLPGTAESIVGIKQAMLTVQRQTPIFTKSAAKLGIAFDRSTVKEKGFVNWLFEAKKKLDDQGASMSDLFRNSQALNAVLALTTKTGMANYNKTMKEMAENTTATKDAFDVMAATMLFKEAQLEGAYKEFSITLGQMFGPIASSWIDFKIWFWGGMTGFLQDISRLWRSVGFTIEFWWTKLWQGIVFTTLEMTNRTINLFEPLIRAMESIGHLDKGTFNMIASATRSGADVAEKKLEDIEVQRQKFILEMEKDRLGLEGSLADSVRKGMEKRDMQRDLQGKSQTNVNLNNTVKLGNKKLHESQKSWEEEFLLRDFVPVR